MEGSHWQITNWIWRSFLNEKEQAFYFQMQNMLSFQKKTNTSMLGEVTPATMAMLLDVLNQELVLFRTPWPSFHSFLVTTWCPSHLHQRPATFIHSHMHWLTHFAEFNKLQDRGFMLLLYMLDSERETENQSDGISLNGIQRLLMLIKSVLLCVGGSGSFWTQTCIYFVLSNRLPSRKCIFKRKGNLLSEPKGHKVPESVFKFIEMKIVAFGYGEWALTYLCTNNSSLTIMLPLFNLKLFLVFGFWTLLKFENFLLN